MIKNTQHQKTVQGSSACNYYLPCPKKYIQCTVDGRKIAVIKETLEHLSIYRHADAVEENAKAFIDTHSAWTEKLGLIEDDDSFGSIIFIADEGGTACYERGVVKFEDIKYFLKPSELDITKLNASFRYNLNLDDSYIDEEGISTRLSKKKANSYFDDKKNYLLTGSEVDLKVEKIEELLALAQKENINLRYIVPNYVRDESFADSMIMYERKMRTDLRNTLKALRDRDYKIYFGGCRVEFELVSLTPLEYKKVSSKPEV